MVQLTSPPALYLYIWLGFSPLKQALKAQKSDAIIRLHRFFILYFRTLDLKRILLLPDSPDTVGFPVPVLFADYPDDIGLHTMHSAMLNSAVLS